MNIKYKLQLIYKLSLIHISEPTRPSQVDIVCRLLLEKKKKKKKRKSKKLRKKKKKKKRKKKKK
ncbi:hypothetical protein, partial [Escherichia coli]|uniref:hypothetical protein n=1 Tax=Escherichia coli TaxID=562 RepID=UPI001BC89301